MTRTAAPCSVVTTAEVNRRSVLSRGRCKEAGCGAAAAGGGALGLCWCPGESRELDTGVGGTLSRGPKAKKRVTGGGGACGT